MTNTKMLREKIENSGYKLRWLASQCGISYQALMNKVNNVSYFRAPEMKVLTELLHLSPEEADEIFFADEVDIESTIHA